MKIEQLFDVPESLAERNDLRESDRLRYKRPTKEAVRSWLSRVIADRRPPPSIEEIQRDLWHAADHD